jgi:hypothetical protein
MDTLLVTEKGHLQLVAIQVSSSVFFHGQDTKPAVPFMDHYYKIKVRIILP